MRTRKRRASARHRRMVQRSTINLRRDNVSRRWLADQVRKRVGDLGLTQTATAKVVRDAATQISRLMNRHDGEFSADRLIGHLVRLGCNVHVAVSHVGTRNGWQRTRRRGRVTLTSHG